MNLFCIVNLLLCDFGAQENADLQRMMQRTLGELEAFHLLGLSFDGDAPRWLK